MSWDIDENTGAIIQHRGDTGAFYGQHIPDDGVPFVEGDVAIFEVLSGKKVMMHREYPLNDDEGEGNGRYLVAFLNSDTDTWPTGTYRVETRVSLAAVRDLISFISVVAVERQDPITATLDEYTLLNFVTEDSGTVDLEYTTEWSEDPTDYGITIEGTPVDGDEIVVSWNKNGTGRVVDGDVVRTPPKAKTTLQILDVDIEI